MKTGISTACLYPLETERALEALLDIGAKNFEVFVNSCSEIEEPFLKKLRSMVEARGANIVSLHPFTSGYESQLLFSKYGRRFDDSLEFYKKYMRAVELLGGEIVVLHGMMQAHETYNVALDDEAYFERYRQLFETAKNFGVKIAQENVRHHVSACPDFISRMRSALGDNCAFVLDVKQCIMAGVKTADMIDAMGDRLCHVHLSDKSAAESCLLPGKGNRNMQKLRLALEERDYDGAVIVEVYRQNFGNDTELETALNYTQSVFE